MFNLSGHKSLIDKKSLIELLDNTISPKAQNLGLIRQGDYLWYPNSTGVIRRGLEYLHLKGGQATLTWGVCIDFIPTYIGSNLTFHKTAKKFKFHLFEWPEEYSNSFFGGNLKNGVTTHWGINSAQKSIKTLFDRNESKINNWYNQTSTIEDLIKTLEHQAEIGKYYNLHSPNPKYVLAFLYAKSCQAERAVNLFDSLELFHFKDKEELRLKTRKKLIDLTE